MISAVLAFLRALPILWQLGIGAAALAAAGGAYWGWHHHVYQQGWTAALEGVAAKDKEAIDAANKARARVRACNDSGGMWDAAGGLCRRR